MSEKSPGADAAKFLAAPMSDDDYGLFLSKLRAAIAEDFPDQAKHIVVLDRRQPFNRTISEAARQFGLENDTEFFERFSKIIKANNYKDEKEIGGFAVTYHDKQNIPYCVVVGYKPSVEPTAYHLVKRNFHEAVHCLDVKESEYNLRLHDQYTPVEKIRFSGQDIVRESFAEIAASAIMIDNGIQPMAEATKLAVAYNKGMTFVGTGGYTLYQPSEGIRQLADLLPQPEKITFSLNGPIKLGHAFAVARHAQELAGYSSGDAIARIFVGGAYGRVWEETFGGDKQAYLAWLAKHEDLDEARRTTVSLVPFNEKTLGDLPGRLNHAQNLARLFVYKETDPSDRGIDILIDAYRGLAFDTSVPAGSILPAEAPGLDAETFRRMETNTGFARSYALRTLSR